MTATADDALVKSAGGGSIGGEQLGGVTSGNVNSSWDNLRAGEATSAHVLVAENAAANTATTVVGTGYNDTFYAKSGTANDSFDGSGGSVFVSGTQTWSNTGGMDIVDYSAATSTLTIDLSNAAGQAITNYGTDTFKNIEGLRGGSAADTFTGSTSDNQFEGRGGNDTFNLANGSAGGHDTLLYRALDATATGGNGVDTVNGFRIGVWESTANADRIDLKALLTGYTADANGAAHYINGVATIDSGDAIAGFLRVNQVGANAVLQIDRDGGGNSFTDLVTMNNVTATLEELLANHQIVVG